jgi:hypothetical protein
MTLIRLPRYCILAGACVLVFAGLSAAQAQFLPSPVQGNANGAFPPPPGAAAAPRQDSAFPPPPGSAAAPSQAPSFGPPPGGAPAMASQGGPPQGGTPFANPAQKVCLEFPNLRDDVSKGFSAIKAASERKVSREEACPMFKNVVVREEKLIKFLETNKQLCGVPPQIITQVKANHSQTVRVRNQVCSAGPAAASGPSLSDALGAPIIADDADATKPGCGTFDTLTGNVLSR